MSDTTVNPAANPAAQIIPKMRIKHAVSFGICRGVESGVKMLDSTADVVAAVATRIKLHNVATAADIIDELGNDKVAQAQELIAKL